MTTKSDPRSAMKALVLSPQSMKSSNLIKSTPMEDSQSSYFPGCRKDANCSCEICLDSINATLDLMPMSVQKSSLTKLSSSKPVVKESPVSIDPTLLSTPTSRTPPPNSIRVSTPAHLRSTGKSVPSDNGKAKKKKLGYGSKFWMWVLLLGVIFGLEFGGSRGFLRVLKARLSEEVVRDVVERSMVVKSLSERLLLIQQGLEGFVDGQVSRCNLGGSSWTIDQDGLILSSQCTLHKSAAEEVIIWGWPLQTSGLLTSGFSSRSFIVLSGRVTQWPEGNMVSMIRAANSTWVQQKWSASVVRFDPNTWIIEYRQSMFLENPGACLAALDFVKFGFSRLTIRMKQKFWGLQSMKNHLFASRSEAHSSIPT
ncbi:hypothetical protein Cgig2_024576 [Carnegiea gigantea]|uniref:C-8 sterol isomerase n=1 Tax=Carnegiea gigantea TaxID=171969 RepID=A0A9Q1KJT1_9CARY|nr:hypothetical protein Cgig2_024576 [Carnegiea gigantea]